MFYDVLSYSSLMHRLTIQCQRFLDASFICLSSRLSLQVNEHLKDILVEEQKLREAFQESNAAAQKVRTLTQTVIQQVYPNNGLSERVLEHFVHVLRTVLS